MRLAKTKKWGEKMEIIIKSNPKEFADFVIALQNRQRETHEFESTAAAIRDILLEFAESDGTRPEPVPEKDF